MKVSRHECATIQASFLRYGEPGRGSKVKRCRQRADTNRPTNRDIFSASPAWCDQRYRLEAQRAPQDVPAHGRTAGRAQTERIREVDGIPARKPVTVEPPRQPDRVKLRGGACSRLPSYVNADANKSVPTSTTLQTLMNDHGQKIH
jgi:hypothetical protein